MPHLIKNRFRSLFFVFVRQTVTFLGHQWSKRLPIQPPIAVSTDPYQHNALSDLLHDGDDDDGDGDDDGDDDGDIYIMMKCLSVRFCLFVLLLYSDIRLLAIYILFSECFPQLKKASDQVFH